MGKNEKATVGEFEKTQRAKAENKRLVAEAGAEAYAYDRSPAGGANPRLRNDGECQ